MLTINILFIQWTYYLHYFRFTLYNLEVNYKRNQYHKQNHPTESIVENLLNSSPLIDLAINLY